MSLLYLVDGYNALKRSGLFQDKPFSEARSAFIAYLDCYRPHGSLRNKLVVVFDGVCDVFSPKESCSFEVIFTQGESADAKIKEMIEASRDLKNTVVVTDDKGILRSVRPHGVRVMSTADFLNKASKELGLWDRSAVSAQEHKADLNIVERESITNELKKIWLKK
jgi:predicted RNA-binding protein with PIN domain